MSTLLHVGLANLACALAQARALANHIGLTRVPTLMLLPGPPPPFHSVQPRRGDGMSYGRPSGATAGIVVILAPPGVGTPGYRRSPLRGCQ